MVTCIQESHPDKIHWPVTSCFQGATACLAGPAAHGLRRRYALDGAMMAASAMPCPASALATLSKVLAVHSTRWMTSDSDIATVCVRALHVLILAPEP